MKFIKLATLILATLVFLNACATIPPPQVQQPLAEEPTPEAALRSDAAEYAEQFGVSQEEALRRFRVQDEAGELNAALQEGEPETFAGLWIQHEPDFRVVAAFTRDAEQTIQPYLEGKSWADLVEVRTFPYSLAELEAAQQQVMQASETLGVSSTSSISVTENRVVVEVGNPELFLDELQAAGLKLPETVNIVAMDPGNITSTLRGGVDTFERPDGEMIYFPRQAPTNAFMAALLQGTLALDANGCLRVEGEGGSAPLILWRHDFTLNIEGETIEVLDGAGEVVGRVGEDIRMGGGEASDQGIPGMPIEACPGPFWALGDIEPLEAQAVPDIFVDPLEILAADGNGTATQGTFLYQSKPAPEEEVLTGPLAVDQDGCLKVGEYTILWPPGVWPRQDPPPLHFVRVEGDTETTVAALGEEVRLSGAERLPGDYRFFENKVRCAGPYWGAASVEPASPETEALPTPTAELQATIIASGEPQVIQSSLSPDGNWRAEVTRWDCVRVGEDEMAYEELKLIQTGDGSERSIDSQLQNCGGLGAAGFEVSYWSSDSRLFYYKISREGVPDGLCWYWYPPLVAVEAASGLQTTIRQGPVSPDQTTLAFWDENDLVLWSIDRGEIMRRPAAFPDLLPGPIAWAPGGQALAYLQDELDCFPFGESALVHLDLPGEQETVLLESEEPSFNVLTWESADQIRLFDADQQEWIFNLSSQELEQAAP
jgi:hypothetical protein